MRCQKWSTPHNIKHESISLYLDPNEELLWDENKEYGKHWYKPCKFKKYLTSARSLSRTTLNKYTLHNSKWNWSNINFYLPAPTSAGKQLKAKRFELVRFPDLS